MSEISVIIPLDVLVGAKELSPQGISDFLTRAIEQREELIAVRTEVRKLMGGIQSYGRTLQLILDEVNNPYEKAQALRNLAAEMKGEDAGGVEVR